MGAIQKRTEAALERCLPAPTQAPAPLHEAMRYAVLGGGKRIRALLAHAAGEITDTPVLLRDRAACAVELIHAYSLVHDDMPCMDDDVLRRGKPTVHVQFDEPTALLTGDALQTLAFQVLSDDGFDQGPVEATVRLNMIRTLAQAAGSRGMAGGQAIDLASVGQSISLEELEFMHIHKTGALIRASVLMGAASGSRHTAATLEQLDHFAKLTGLLFQVVDDLLDAQSDTATLGKTAGKDAAHDKPTYVSLMGPVAARALAADLAAQARETLAPLGETAANLDAIARFIFDRPY